MVLQYLIPFILDYASKQGAFGKSTEQQLREGMGKSEEELKLLKESGAESIESLISDARTKGSEFLTGVKTSRADRLKELETLLGEREERLFSESTPGILEDLSSRDLLHSSAVGEAFAKERGRLGAESREILTAQQLADLDVEQQLAKEIEDRIFGLKVGGVEREFSLEDLGRSERLAREIGGLQASTGERGALFQLLGGTLGSDKDFGLDEFFGIGGK